MKRWLVVGGAIVVSLVVAWAAAYTASRIDWRTARSAWPGCREAGHCEAATWIDGLLLAWLVGPPLLFASVAFVGCRKNWSAARWLGWLVLLSAFTAPFYCAWYIFFV